MIVKNTLVSPAFLAFRCSITCCASIVFCAATAVLYYQRTDIIENVSASLYAIGSLGFLVVDVVDFCTFTTCFVRSNIILNLIGNVCYVIGSIGFFPLIYNDTTGIGIWAWILGSVFVGVSAAWKCLRILRKTTLLPQETFTEFCAEFGPCIGAWCFFLGTGVMVVPASPDQHKIVLDLWISGSVFFTIGACFLVYRFVVMRI